MPTASHPSPVRMSPAKDRVTQRPSSLRRLGWAAFFLILVAVVYVMNVGSGGRSVWELFPSGNGSSDTAEATRTSSGGSTRAAERARHELEKKKLEAFRIAAEESAARDFANVARNSAVIPIAPGGTRLTTAAIESLNLNKQEIELITEELGALRADVIRDMSSRAELVTSAQDDGSGTTTYLIRARSDRGKGFSDQLLRALQDIVGNDKAAKFMAGVERSDYFGKCGKFDMQFDFSQRDGETFVKYQYIDPDSGRPSRFGGCSIASFNEEFGDLFTPNRDE